MVSYCNNNKCLRKNTQQQKQSDVEPKVHMGGVEMTSIVKDKHHHYYIAKKVRVDEKETMHQINLMKTLRHPNIISLHEIIWEGQWAYIIEEYCEEGDLEYHLKRHLKMKKKIPEEVISRWMVQILLAVQYLHHSKIIHRDIRPKNIFLTTHGNIKLGSFKASKMLQEEMGLAQTLINSSYYMTPQLMDGKGYDCKVDIWAFGCVLYELCWLKPFISMTNLADMVNKLTNGKVDDLPPNYSKQLNLIYQKCMKKKSIERVSGQDLLKTKYFLAALQKFISDEGLNITLQGKIPIKKYNIHRYKYQNLKRKRGLVKDRLPSAEKKQHLLPKIEGYANNLERKTSQGKQVKREIIINHTPVMKANPISKEAIVRRSVSTEKKKIKTQTHYKSKQKAQGLQRLNSERLEPRESERDNKFMMAPPLLPKPLKKAQKKTTQRKETSKSIGSEEDLNENLATTMSKQQLSKELANFQKKDLKQINEGLNKMFENWKMGQEEEIEFEMEEESELRLTSKPSKQEEDSLLKTFKSKLEQLIEQINYKYCPDMQTIAEKTLDFDSNSFSTLQPRFQS